MTINPLRKDTFNKPFLRNCSSNVVQYYVATCEMMRDRIHAVFHMNKKRAEDNETKHLEKLDEIWNSLTKKEIEQVNNLPRMWWFQHSDETGMTEKSEFDVYEYAKYFVLQEPHLLGKDTSTMIGTPFFGDKKWKPNTAVMYLMIEEESNGELKLHMVTMSNEHYEELQRDYDFVRYVNNCPVFKKK
jgi:hypothetical protein